MATVFEDEGDTEPTISIGDYLKAVEEEELEADLVLGGDEGKECTYGKGYTKRQAIFSCLSCTPDGNAGVCTACSLSCHDGHEIVELWTKRNFRCDCGNSKFGEFFCKLLANKEVENSENMYNHNFRGIYCTCDLPYPDPNAEEQVEMIQCCICEDWFHEEHIGLQDVDKIPKDEEDEPQYEDFICQGCAVVCSFLTYYPQTLSTSDSSKSLKEKAVLETAPAVMTSNELDNGTALNAGDSVNTQNGKCILEIDLVENSPSLGKSKAMFLSKGWRDIICKCKKCADFYAKRRVGYLVDKEDSIPEYESMAKQKRDENLQKQEGIEMKFLDDLGHVEKMEILSGIADMKNEFRAFLESSDPSKAVTPADVQQVFENLAKKRKRMP
ncbi:uncharacterized protein LOC142555629 [Primulina tabacum]|uniref:uncharacterized protein LOC142555629 n=1 Tax=Primulina tabacum TaxID=48773 RepID=UPI003F59B5C0